MAADGGRTERAPWHPRTDPEGRFSTGIPDFDRLLDGGPRRGSIALFSPDGSIGTPDLHLLLTPIWLNFLHQSRGILAILPARESPGGFREDLLRFTTRRLFDSRVRVVDYVGEAEPAPYVVPLVESIRARSTPKDTRIAMERMEGAERAVRGARGRPILEWNALEVLETLVGIERASKMYFLGAKRARAVGNLMVTLARPGLGVFEAARGLADYEFDLSHSELGLEIRGRRPEFGRHLVVPDRKLGSPHVEFVPASTRS